MFNKKFLTILCSLLFVFNLSVFAQFTGTIGYKTFDLNKEKDGTHLDGSFMLSFSANRIMICDFEDYNVSDNPMGIEDASSILIRSDKKDYVIVTDEEKTALVIKQSDIEGMMKMFDAMKNMSEENDWDDEAKKEIDEVSSNLERTNQTMNIQGYNCRLFRVHEEDEETGEDGTVHIWMPEDLKINWGMLVDNSMVSDIFDSDNTILGMFKYGSLPLRVEFLKNSKIQSYIECTYLIKKNLSDSELTVPIEYKEMGFQQFILKQMMGN